MSRPTFSRLKLSSKRIGLELNVMIRVLDLEIAREGNRRAWFTNLWLHVCGLRV